MIIKDGTVIGTGYNCKEKDNNPVAHAEIMAIQDACKNLGTWRLSGCEMYVTLEPCIMCAGAIIQSRLDRVVIGCMDEKAGAVGSVIHAFHMPFNHSPAVSYGVMEEECTSILKTFFENLRAK